MVPIPMEGLLRVLCCTVLVGGTKWLVISQCLYIQRQTKNGLDVFAASFLARTAWVQQNIIGCSVAQTCICV